MADYWLYGNGDRMLLPDGSGLFLLSEQPPPLPPIIFEPAPAAAASAVLGPAVIKGSITIAPTNAAAKGDRANPTAVIASGSKLVEPSPASAVGAVLGPVSVKGSLTFGPDPAEARSDVAIDPVGFFALVVSPEPASVRCDTNLEHIIKTIGYLFTHEAAIAVIWTPQDPRN